MSKNLTSCFRVFLVILLVKNVLHSIIRKNFPSKNALMIELTLLTLLNHVGDNFCEQNLIL